MRLLIAAARSCAEGTERGAVAALVAIFLPVLVLAAGLVMDLGAVFVTRHVAYAAADLAALAAVQDVDLDRLAEGELCIVEGEARRDATRYALENLRASLRRVDIDGRARIEVEVYNPEPGHPLRHRETGRLLRTPTVSVRISVPMRTYFVTFLVREVRVAVRADASVVRKAGNPG
ncbi:MAG: pilus assembly protein TadG-related protein [Actinobacteria bacterium]|nr:pilus assembly protein TadG-related protein [Actinomycetota bacterium]